MEKKADIIERFNKTPKGALYKTLANRRCRVWFEILPELINDYNNKFHKTICMKLTEVNKHNKQLLLERILRNTAVHTRKKGPKTFNRGNKVRLSKHKGLFGKKIFIKLHK